MINRVRIFTLLVVGSALASCGGDPNLTGPGPRGGEPQMNRIIKEFPSFEVDVQEIFVRTGCTDGGCHSAGEGASGQGDLTLNADSPANFTEIVNMPARGEREFLLVEPFDATNSYIIIRLENRQRVGVPMPPGFRLDDVDLTNLRNWIDNGAPNN